MISVGMFLCVELVAAAVLALWVAARFPGFGPRSLRSSLAVLVVSFTALQLAAGVQDSLIELPHGAYVFLFGSVLPSFFVAFLAAAWLLRALAAAYGGSGGGGGHRIPAEARR